MNTTPYQYVLKQRIEKSKSLLHQRQYAIADIAQMVSFADQSRFTRHFRNYVGVTPRIFAKQE
jgi:AraC family transcriptional regulator